MSATTVDRRPSNRWLYVAVAVLMGASLWIQAVRDRDWTPFIPTNRPLWLQAGPAVNRVFLGYKNLVADVYWIRGVVYYGSRRREVAEARERGEKVDTNFDLLYPLLDLATSLDPQFKVAYRLGSLFLAEPQPDGPGRPDLAVALLQRGIERDAPRWEYMEDIGFVHYWWTKDYDQAAQWFQRGADQPGAPKWLAQLAATTLAQGGNREGARVLWSQLLNSDVEFVRRDAARRLQQLEAMEQIDDLNARIERFVEREGKLPSDWRQVGIPVAPVDPTGTPYQINPDTGRFDLGPGSKLFPLPR